MTDRLKAERTIREERRRLERALRRGFGDNGRDAQAAWGAMQALSWALGDDAMKVTSALGLTRG